MARTDMARRGHRMERIERAVAEALEYEILPSLDDPYLTDLHVLSVEATSNLSNVTVLLSLGDMEDRTKEDVQERLTRLESYLRTELAGILRMKRIPTLRLRILDWPSFPVAPGEGGPHENMG